MPDPSNVARWPKSEVDSLIQIVDSRELLEGRSARRAQVRHFMHGKVGFLRLNQGGTMRDVPALLRNISAGGCSLIVGVFQYPDTPCALQIRTLDEEAVLIPGRITRCNLITGRAHDLGMRFDKPIDISLYVSAANSEAGDGPGSDGVHGLEPMVSKLSAAGKRQDWAECRQKLREIDAWLDSIARLESDQTPEVTGPSQRAAEAQSKAENAPPRAVES
jgi:hypothetical protein